MKTLKLNHELAELVLSGAKTSTWRINDDKDISVNDQIEFVDKVNPKQKNTWQIIGMALVDEVINKRLGEISEEDVRGHEEYPSTDAMYKTLRSYYGKGIGPETPVKIIKFHFKQYKTPKRFQPQSNYPVSYKHIKLFADGGSRGNPGPSASGFVLLDMYDNVVIKSGIYLGITTNNQAEYIALKSGLEEAIKLQAEEVDVYLDSLLVINQMKGLFKVKNRDLWPIHQSIRELEPHFKKITYTHVPREYNKLADGMVNETLDAEAGK